MQTALKTCQLNIIFTYSLRRSLNNMAAIFAANIWLLIKISLNFVPKGPFAIESVLVQVMAYRRHAASFAWTNTD